MTLCIDDVDDDDDNDDEFCGCGTYYLSEMVVAVLGPHTLWLGKPTEASAGLCTELHCLRPPITLIIAHCWSVTSYGRSGTC